MALTVNPSVHRFHRSCQVLAPFVVTTSSSVSFASLVLACDCDKIVQLDSRPSLPGKQLSALASLQADSHLQTIQAAEYLCVCLTLKTSQYRAVKQYSLNLWPHPQV
jgi:hypothetical protein